VFVCQNAPRGIAPQIKMTKCKESMVSINR